MKNKLFIVFLLLIVYICVLFGAFYFTFTLFLGKPINSKTIKNKFLDNYDKIEQAVTELNNDNQIYIRQENGFFKIHIYTETSILSLDEEHFYKYEKIINIMKELKISSISKEDSNISILFNSMIGLGQFIVNIGDKGIYYKNHSVLKFEEIKNQWYYVETK